MSFGAAGFSPAAHSGCARGAPLDGAELVDGAPRTFAPQTSATATAAAAPTQTLRRVSSIQAGFKHRHSLLGQIRCRLRQLHDLGCLGPEFPLGLSPPLIVFTWRLLSPTSIASMREQDNTPQPVRR